MKKTKTVKSGKEQNQAGKQVLVNVVLDRSASMAGTATETISGYNEYIGGLRSDKETEYSITLIQFCRVGGSPELTVSYRDCPIKDVSDLTSKDYTPRGLTPLYDAIGECVRRVDEKDGRGVITLIITDGAENASVEFTRDSVKALISEKERCGWSFVFIGANMDSAAAGGSIGISSVNTANYNQGNERSTYRVLAQATNMRSSAMRSMGPLSAAGMSFTTDAQKKEMMSGAAGKTSFPKGSPVVAKRRPTWTVTTKS